MTGRHPPDRGHVAGGARLVGSRKGTEFSPEMRAKMAAGQRRRRERESPEDYCNRGKVWIAHPSEGVRFIHQTELEAYLALGWSKGRKVVMTG